MNFDELQKQWNNQDDNNVTLKTEYLNKTKSLATKIKKGFANEIIIWIISVLLLTIIPFIDIYRISGTASIIYYFLLIQMILFGMFYYRRLYTVYRMLQKPNTFNSREGIIRLYYEFLFAVESYRSSIYIMTPTALAMYFILFSYGHYEDVLQKILNIKETYIQNPTFVYIIALTIIFAIAIVIAISELVIYKFYGKYLKELRSIKEEFND